MTQNRNSENTALKVKNSRRSFIKSFWKGLGIIAALQFSWIGLSFFTARERVNKKGAKLITVGKTSDFKRGEVYPFRNGQFYLVRFENGGFLALSLKCSHLGCSVIWNERDQKFNCPCHASSFGKTGEVIDPPAPRALDTYPIIVEQGLIKVDTALSEKRKTFETAQLTFV